MGGVFYMGGTGCSMGGAVDMGGTVSIGACFVSGRLVVGIAVASFFIRADELLRVRYLFLSLFAKGVFIMCFVL